VFCTADGGCCARVFLQNKNERSLRRTDPPSQLYGFWQLCLYIIRRSVDALNRGQFFIIFILPHGSVVAESM